MFFPLIPKDQADLILETAAHEDEAMGEFLAEQGSSYFFGGMTSADAQWAAHSDLREREREFNESSEGQEYNALLEAATLFQDVRNLELLFVPEFFPVDYPAPYTVPTPHGFVEPVRYDDIPF
jgi:hypothetical protein